MSVSILAINGSSRRDSLNQKLLKIAANGAAQAGAEVTFVRLADLRLPLYDGDLETDEGIPAGARDLQDLLACHQGLLVATPEYNGGYTALLKNAIDWASRPRADGSAGVALFAGKAAALVSASPGQMGGLRSQTGMRAVLDKLGMIVVPQSFALASAHDAFDGDGQLRDRQAERLVGEVGASLFRTAARLS
ncbi:NADPH-dependent FMN reductase [Burkholderia cenocepacia]|uniref:NADPH-dependent oxidoreductase n=1 Tax=Burkholderia cenocepacia TaxID=95486 RepID=A0A3Q9FBF8_9BURK|nr:NAD(P)H-dependent oxidoreductase [Burkholderia cenocepacia]AZQ54002.1 NADPH-dependent oxidoreductase [Burkholderia cenocepacia]